MLNSLHIKNFRSLKDFQVKKLGRVNLIFGDNNSGKSTILEALRIYAGNGNQGLLKQIAQAHDEVYRLDNASLEAGTSTTQLPYADLFPRRKFPADDAPIVIGEIGNEKADLTIRHTYLLEKLIFVKGVDGAMAGKRETLSRTQPMTLNSLTDDDHVAGEGLLVEKARHSTIVNFDETAMASTLFANAPKPIPLPCRFVSAQAVHIDALAADWDAIAFTEEGEVVKSIVRLLLPGFENLAFIKDTTRSETGAYRLAVVKLNGLPSPVYLKSLGGGVLRILQLALSLFPAKGGLLLIDEFDVGLHATVQEKLWCLLFDLSKKLDIQIFATTLSEDCINHFCGALSNYDDHESCLLGVEKAPDSYNPDAPDRVFVTVYENQNQLESRFDSWH